MCNHEKTIENVHYKVATIHFKSLAPSSMCCSRPHCILDDHNDMREYDAENSNSQIFCVVYVNCVVVCLSLFIFGHFFSVLFSLLCIFSMKIESIFFQFSFDLFGLTICCECEWIISIYKRWLSWRKNVRLRRKKRISLKNETKN